MYDDDHDFSKEAKTFEEYRTERVGTAIAQSPRQMLIALLRDIDSGALNVESLAICGIVGRAAPTTDSPVTHSIYLRFGGRGSQFEFSGLLERSQQLLWRTQLVRLK